MLHRILSIAVILGFAVGISLAEETRGVITKVDGDKVTFTKTTFNKETKKVEKGESQTLPAPGVKVFKGMFNKETKKMEKGEAVQGGLNSEAFKSIGEKGVFATIVTDADNKKITEIIISGERKKKD